MSNRLLINETEGRFKVARTNYTDPDLLREEMDKIFATCWLYVGHESEIPKPGDFLTRKVGNRPVIFVRDKEGTVRCFLNICPHRGAQICRHKSGRAANFSCMYHGWVFRNDGKVAEITELDNYPAGFGTSENRDLMAVPRLENYRGLYFLNYDAGAVTLKEYLAGAADYIDLIFDQAEEGMQIVPGVQEYGIGSNWKLLSENSVDMLHGSILHATYLDLIMANSGGSMPYYKVSGGSVELGNGHVVIEREAFQGRPIARWIPIWGEEAKTDIEATYARLVAKYGEERAAKMARSNRNMLIFPNFVINDVMSITLRTFTPVRADAMDVTVWTIAPREELGTEALNRRLMNFNEFFGPAGFAAPDDVEALESCQRAYANAPTAPWNDFSKGMESSGTDPNDESAQRIFWRQWQKLLSAGGNG